MADAADSPLGDDKARVDKPRPGDDDSFVPVVGAKLVLLIVSLSLGCFLILLDTAIVSTAVPKITDDFHSLSDVGWYGSAYLLGSSSLQPLTGKVFVNFNLKWSFIAFFLVFELGSALCGASQSSNMLIISRAISGVGASGLINGALVILSAAVPLQKRPPLMGIIMGVGQFGVVLGPLIGGAFTTGYTWRWCFYINLPLGLIVAVPLILLHIPEQVPKDPLLVVLRSIHRRFDLIGFTFFAPAIVQLLLALQFGGDTYPWKSSQVIGLFCGFAATLAVWCVWNSRQGSNALLNFDVIRRRRVWMSGICYTCITIIVFGNAYFLPIYFQAVKGVNAVMSGVYMLAGILPQVISSIFSGVLVTKIGYVPPFVLFAGVLLAVSNGLMSLFQPGTPVGQWVGYQILVGVGRGSSFQMPLVAVQHNTSPAELSDGMTFIVFCQYIGPAIFLTVLNTIFDSRLRVELRELVPDINPAAILKAGATGFRKIVSAEQLPGILKAYSNSLDTVFYIAAGAGCFVFFLGFGMGWNNLADTGKKPASALQSSSASVATGNEKSSDPKGLDE